MTATSKNTTTQILKILERRLTQNPREIQGMILPFPYGHWDLKFFTSVKMIPWVIHHMSGLYSPKERLQIVALDEIINI